MEIMLKRLPSFEIVRESAVAGGLVPEELNHLRELYEKILSDPVLTVRTLEYCNAIICKKGKTDFGKKYFEKPELGRFRLLLILLCYPAARKNYEAEGYAEENFRDAWRDLAHWCDYYRKEVGELRIDDDIVFEWYFLHVTAQLIPMGRLQFQLPVYYHETADLAPWVLPGDPMVEFHIYGGEPLEINACRDSFRRLPEWLARFRKDYSFRGLIGHSWLFDPELDRFLPESGNIAQFRKMGHLIPTPEPSDVLWRIFGTQDPDKMEHPSTLQRKIRDFYREGGQLHFGYWVMTKEELLAL